MNVLVLTRVFKSQGLWIFSKYENVRERKRGWGFASLCCAADSTQHTLNPKFQINIHKYIHHRSSNIILKLRDPILESQTSLVNLTEKERKKEKTTWTDSARTTIQGSGNHSRVHGILLLQLTGHSHTYSQHRGKKGSIQPFFTVFGFIVQYLNKPPLFSKFICQEINSAPQKLPHYPKYQSI